MDWLTKLFSGILVGLAVGSLPQTPVQAQAPTVVEAYTGRPFGVGRITLNLPASAGSLTRDEVLVTGEGGRVLYPVVSAAPVRKMLGNLLSDGSLLGALAREMPAKVSVYFLFQGDTPFRVTVDAAGPRQFTVTPRTALRGDDRLLRAWWREYSLAAREQTQQGDYPPVVETYLTNTLGRRLGLDRAPSSREPQATTRMQQTLDLLLGVEDLRRDVMTDTLQSTVPPEEATLPPPDEIAWPATTPPEAPADVEIEPIAMRVPEECFYLRFGSIANFIWLHHLTQEHGGALGRLISLRGHDAQAIQRVENRLAVRYSMLLDLVGERVVDDLAIFGRDTYLREGPAMGVVIKAKNAFLVSAAITGERTKALEREKENGATSQSLRIGGRSVSLFSTPDQRLRSFFVRDGDYFLLTTSQALVERFFEVRDGKGALGASDDFRHARTLLPVSRGDAIFAFFSPKFFRGLVGPQYQIELPRRLRATTDIELVEMARLAAKAEGRPHATLEDLIVGGFLPSDFDRRPDGSHVVIEGDRVYDSLRGARGNFLPITDTPVISVTPGEARRFASATSTWAYQWRDMDALMIGLQRSERDDGGVERITVDGYVSPFFEEKFGPYLSYLGPPMTQTLAPVEGNLLSAEFSLQGGSAAADVPPHLLFLGVQDSPRVSMQGWPGVIKSLAFLRTVPGYLGATPKPGFVDLLPLGLSPAPDRNGYSQLPLGVWRRQAADFSVLAFDPQLLSRVTPQLVLHADAPPAQARVRIGDLVAAKHTSWINEFFLDRAAASTNGNLRLLATLTQQLHVPASQARTEAERLLDVRLVCPLGGEYRLESTPANSPQWTTTARSVTPAEYRPPLLGWLRGGEGQLTKTEGRLTLHAEIAMQRKDSPPTLKLPPIPFFGGE